MGNLVGRKQIILLPALTPSLPGVESLEQVLS